MITRPYAQRAGRLLTLPLIALFIFASAACSDSALTKLSQALDDTAKAVGAAQAIVIAANQAGTISVNDTAAILQVCNQINQAGLQASAATRKITSLNSTSKTQILAILQPVVTAVNNAVATGTLNIKDPTTKTNVQTALVAIQTVLVSAQVIVAS